MRYMMMVKATKDFEAGRPPNQKLMAGMGKLAAEMVRSGTLLASDGLQPSSQGTRVTYADGKRRVVDGPFTETKELIAGYAVLQAGSKAEAIELANRCLEVHIEAGVPEVEIEIRPLLAPAEFVPPSQ
jgi:hypothetical protein